MTLKNFPMRTFEFLLVSVLLYNNYLTIYEKVKISIFSRTLLKNHNFCFLGIDFQFCSPVLDRDKMIKSSAYNREFSFAPFGKTKGSDNVFSKAKGRSLI